MEQIRVLMMARRSAREQRIQSLNRMRHLVSLFLSRSGSDKDRYKTGLVSEAANMGPNKGSDPVTYPTNVVPAQGVIAPPDRK